MIKKKFSKKIALIDEKFNKISYHQLIQEIYKIKKIFGVNNLILIPGNNNLISISCYFACLSSKNACMIYDKNYSKVILEKLITKYIPDLLILNKNIKIKGYSLIKKNNIFYFLRRKNKNKLPINSKIKLLMPTSGSTGSSKMVMLSKKNLYDNTRKILNYLKIKDTDTTITNLPMSYVYGLSVINSHMYNGASLKLTDRSITEKKFLKFLDIGNITNLNGVPATFQILMYIRYDFNLLKNLKFITIAGGSLPQNTLNLLRKKLKKKKIKIFLMYGAAEATARMSYKEVLDSKIKSNCIGKPVKGGKFYLFKKDKLINKPNIIGDLVYSGKNVFLGYSNNRGDLYKKIYKNNYLKTNDLAYFDREKNFFIKGRSDNYKKISGNRVNINEIEIILQKKGVYSNCEEYNGKLLIKIPHYCKASLVEKILKNFTRLNNNYFNIIKVKKFEIKKNKEITYK